MCSTSTLSKVASSILSMATTSAATERSFSTYSRIHTKSRNRLKTERAGKIVYISHNLKLLTNHTTKKTTTTATDAGKHHGFEVLLHSSTTSTDQVQDPSESGSGLSAATVTKRLARSNFGIPAKRAKQTLAEDSDELENRSTDETTDTDNDSIALDKDTSFSNDDGDSS